MNFSFSRGQKLWVGGLVAMMVLCVAIAVHSLRDVVRGMRHQVEVQAVKAERWSHIAASFSQVGLSFYRQRLEERFDLSSLLPPLDAIRSLAADLKQGSLTPPEQGGLDQLVTEEKRIRTALHLVATLDRSDPSEASETQVETELTPIISGAIDQANHLGQLLSGAIKTRHERLIQSLHDTTLVLLIGAGLACLLGILATRLMIRTVDRPLRAMRTALYNLMAGHFSYRLQAPFSGAMGELADCIDSVAHLLEKHAVPPQSLSREPQPEAGHHSKTPIPPVKSSRH